MAAAQQGDRHDRALWMPTATAVGAYGDTTALVGTPDTIIASLLDYVDLGVTTFLNRATIRSMIRSIMVVILSRCT